METAYVLVKSQVSHEMDVMRELLKLDLVNEANSTKEIEDVVTKQIRKIKFVLSTTTLSVIPEQG